MTYPQTWRVDTQPYHGPECVWCGRPIRACGAGAPAPCDERIAYWAAHRDPLHCDPADPT